MEEKMMQVRNDHPRRSQKRRRKRFPWGDIVATLLVVAICAYVFMSFGAKTPDEETQVRGTPSPTTTQAQDNALADLLAENAQPTASDIDWNLVLVNYENAIPENYEINLVEVAGGEKVDERIYDPLMEMLEAAKEGNWDQLPMVVSGYRTQAKQQKLFNDKVAKYQNEGHSKSEAEEMAKQWVAVPRYSEHQIGLAVDINGATYDLYSGFRKTVTSTALSSAILAIRQNSPAWPRKSGITAMWAWKRPRRCTKRVCAWRNIWRKGREKNEQANDRRPVRRLFPGVWGVPPVCRRRSPAHGQKPV